MSTWEPWDNQTLDDREAASKSSNAAANKASGSAPSGEMRDVKQAATGTGAWPAAKPIVGPSSRKKEQV